MFLSLLSSSFAFDLKFEEGKEITLYEQINPIILTLVIDNSNPADYVSDVSEISYLELRTAGKHENIVRFVNERDFRDSGLFIDKGVKERIQVELRLPATQKWEKEYEVLVVGISPDNRQREALIIVKPTGEQVKTMVDDIPWSLLIIGLVGLIIIIALVIIWDKNHKKRRLNY